MSALIVLWHLDPNILTALVGGGHDKVEIGGRWHRAKHGDEYCELSSQELEAERT